MTSTLHHPTFSNAAGSLTMHPAGYVRLRCHPGPWPASALAALLTHLGHVLLQYQWHRVLVDAQQMPLLPAATKEWVLREWQGQQVPRPQTLELAVLQPSDALARLCLTELLAHGRHGSACRTFPNEAAARARTPWLG